MKKFDFVVLGAGVAGLSFAKKVSEAGYSVIILEKEKVVGGLSRTLNHKGFLLDFCAHRFHTKNREVLDEVMNMDLRWGKHLKKSRVYIYNKYLKYPYEMQNLLRAMPIHQSILCGASFLQAQIIKPFDKKDIKSYKDWFVYFYGRHLYNYMMKNYTEKIWHMDPSKLSADWADQRFQGEDLKKLVKRMVEKLMKLDFSKHSLEDDSLAPDGGEFYYPEGGIQEMPEAFARAAEKNGGKIVLSANVLRINRNNKTIEYEKDGKKQKVKYSDLISTIPLHILYKLQNRKDKDLEKELSNNKYMDIIFVYLFVNKSKISNDHWLYFPDKDIIFNRAVEFSNWSPKMCPKGKTSVCFDITCYEGDKIWDMSDDKIAAKVISDADRIDYIKKDFVDSSFVFRIKYAYPVYDLKYKDRLNKIVKFLEDKNTFLLGRTGIFRYNNSDNSIEMGIELAKNFILKKKDKTIYKYKIKKVSY